MINMLVERIKNHKTAGKPFCTTNVARRAKHRDVLSEIANNAEFEMDDFDLIPECKQQGGLLKAQALFGKKLPVIVQELNGYLIA